MILPKHLLVPIKAMYVAKIKLVKDTCVNNKHEDHSVSLN